jgi:hypothetical protein
MSNLSIKSYNSSIKELTNYRDNLRYQIEDYRDSLSMLEQLAIIHEVREVNNKIIALQESLPRKKLGFNIDHEKKLQELDVKYKTLANETRENLTSEERDLISKEIDKFLETRTQIQKQQQKEISGRGKNRKRKITKKRKHKKRKTKKRKSKNKHKTKKR